MNTESDGSGTVPYIVGYLCGHYPDGPMIPAQSYDKPCPLGDKAVYSDGGIGSPKTASAGES